MTANKKSAKKGRSANEGRAKSAPRASRPFPPRRSERQTQFTLKMRESLHRELAYKALDAGMTMRGYIMQALRDAGLQVTDADLVDGRRRDD